MKKEDQATTVSERGRQSGAVDEFDLKLAEYAFRLKGDSGVVKDYVLEELDGDGRDDYLSSLSARMTKGSDGKSKLTDFKGLQSSLIFLRLFEVHRDGTRTAVPEEVIRKWPARIQQKLFAQQKKQSGLDEEAEDKAKND